MRVSCSANISFKLILQEKGRVSCRRFDELGRTTLEMKGWERGPASSEKVEGPSWEGERDTDPSWANLATAPRGTDGLGQCCLLLGLPTPFLVTATFYSRFLLQRQELLALFSRWHRQVRSESRAAVLPLTAGCPRQLLTSSVPGVNPACWAACGMEGSRGLPLENI